MNKDVHVCRWIDMWVGGLAECWTERRTGNWINDYGGRQAGRQTGRQAGRQAGRQCVKSGAATIRISSFTKLILPDRLSAPLSWATPHTNLRQVVFLNGAGFRNSLLGRGRNRSNCIVKSLLGIYN